MTGDKKTQPQKERQGRKRACPNLPPALRQRPKGPKDLLDALPDLMFDKDAEGFYRDCNRAFAEQLGRKKAAIIGRRDEELYPPMDAAARRRCDRLTLLQARSRCDVECLAYPDGRRVWVETCRTPCQGPDGQLHIFGLSRELTERMKREAPSQVEDREERPPAIRETAGEATERWQAERIMIAQRDLSLALSGTHSLQEALSICLDTAIQVSGLDCGGIYVADPGTGDFHLAREKGLSAEFIEKIRHIPAPSDRARLVRAGRPVYLEQSDRALLRHRDQRQEGLKSIALLPIASQERIIGCLNIASHALGQIPLPGRHALEAIASQIGMAIANAQAGEALRNSEKRNRDLVDFLPITIF
nr:GAF domain-containing protein [Deltaproteobacteria bacterium]